LTLWKGVASAAAVPAHAVGAPQRRRGSPGPVEPKREEKNTRSLTCFDQSLANSLKFARDSFFRALNVVKGTRDWCKISTLRLRNPKIGTNYFQGGRTKKESCCLQSRQKMCFTCIYPVSSRYQKDSFFDPQKTHTKEKNKLRKMMVVKPTTKHTWGPK